MQNALHISSESQDFVVRRAHYNESPLLISEFSTVSVYWGFVVSDNLTLLLEYRCPTRNMAF
jgi:hypothetical protein